MKKPQQMNQSVTYRRLTKEEVKKAKADVRRSTERCTEREGRPMESR